MKKRILILLCAMALSPAVFASGSQNFFKLHIFDNDTREIKSLLNSQVRYANIARFLHLEGSTDAELVDALIAHIQNMNKQLDIPTCIKDYEGGIIDEKEFMEKLPTVAELAVGDACTGSNPRSINPEQMAKLLKCCYYDEEVDF